MPVAESRKFCDHPVGALCVHLAEGGYLIPNVRVAGPVLPRHCHSAHLSAKGTLALHWGCIPGRQGAVSMSKAPCVKMSLALEAYGSRSSLIGLPARPRTGVSPALFFGAPKRRVHRAKFLVKRRSIDQNFSGLFVAPCPPSIQRQGPRSWRACP